MGSLHGLKLAGVLLLVMLVAVVVVLRQDGRRKGEIR